MMNLKSLAAMALVPAALALSGQTAPAQPHSYTVAMVVSDNGEIIGDAKLLVRAGVKSGIRIDKGDGRIYRTDLLFSEAEEDLYRMKYELNVISPTLGEVTGYSRQLTIRKEEPVRIEYGNVAPGVRPLRIELTLSDG